MSATGAEIVIYANPERELALDVYRPASEQRDSSPNYRTAVIQVHGGGWRRGSKEMMAPRCEALRALGFVCVAPEYRFLDEAPWPAQLDDIKAAIRWVRANADQLDIDPDRIVIQGNSAGGHLALMAAGTVDEPEWEGRSGNPGISTAVAAAVGLYAPVEFFEVADRFPEGAEIDPAEFADLRRPDGSVPAAMLLGGGANAEAAKAASPLTHVSPMSPPTMLIHGLADTVVYPDGARRMQQALLEVGVACDLALYADQIHEFEAGPVFAEVVADAVAGFLRRVVIEPELFSADGKAHNPFLQAR